MKKYKIRHKDGTVKEVSEVELAKYGLVPEAKSGIKIKPSKKGTFKAQATKMDMGVQEAASKILNAPEGKYSPEMRKKANFAKNFAKQDGGEIEYDEEESVPLRKGNMFSSVLNNPYEDRANYFGTGQYITDSAKSSVVPFETRNYNTGEITTGVNNAPFVNQYNSNNPNLSGNNLPDYASQINNPNFGGEEKQNNAPNSDIFKTLVQGAAQIEPLARNAGTSLGNVIKNKRTEDYEANQLNQALRQPYNNQFSEDMFGSNQGLQLPSSKNGGLANNQNIFSNQMISKFSGDKHYEGGIPINTEQGFNHANDLKTNRKNANLEVEDGEYFIPMAKDGASFVASDVKKLGRGGKSPSELIDIRTKEETGISADMLTKKLSKREKLLKDNKFYTNDNISNQTTDIISLLSAPIIEQHKAIAQEEIYAQEGKKYRMGKPNDFASLQMENNGMMKNGGILPKMQPGGDIDFSKLSPKAKQALTATMGFDFSDPNYKIPESYKKLSDTELFNVIEQMKLDGNGMPRLTSDIYAELEGAGFTHNFLKPNSQTSTQPPLNINTPTNTTPATNPVSNSVSPLLSRNPRVKSNYPEISYPQTTENNFKYGKPEQYDWLNWQNTIDKSAANSFGDGKGFQVPIATDENRFQRYGVKDEQGLVNAAYQEQSYDDALDTFEGRIALAKMWEKTGKTLKGKDLGIETKGLTKLNDTDLKDVLSRLRGAYIDSQLDYRKVDYITPQNIKGKQKPTVVGDDPKLQSKITGEADKTKGSFNMPQFFPMGIPVVGGEEAAARFELPNTQAPFRRMSAQPQINEINRNTDAGLRLLGNTPTDVSNIANLLAQANIQGQQAIGNVNMQNAQNQMNVDQFNSQLDRQRAIAQMQEDVRFTENIAKRKGLMQTEANMNKAAFNQSGMNMFTELRDKNYADKIYSPNAWENYKFNFDPMTGKELKKEDEKKKEAKYGGKIKAKLTKKSSK